MHLNSVLFTLILLLFSLTSEARVADQLQLFMTLAPEDSVTQLIRHAPDGLTVVVTRLEGEGTVATREERLQIPAQAIEKLLVNARQESIAVQELSLEEAQATQTENEVQTKIERINRGNTGTNKFQHVSSQTFFSAYVYGLAVPLALDLESEAGSIFLVSLPVAFGSHYAIAWDRTIYQSHLYGAQYGPAAALGLSYGGSLLAFGPHETSFRAGSFLALGTYPLGLYLGLRYGDHMKQNPGRISLEASLAGTGAFLGLFSSFLWGNRFDDEEVGVRILAGQMIVGGIAGHYLSRRYRDEERISLGIGPGILQHVGMGTLMGATLLTFVEDVSVESVGLLLGGGMAAGLGHGLWFFQDQWDTQERAGYTALGLVGGMSFPLGLLALLSNDFSAKETVSLVTAGALTGYSVTRWFTKHLIEPQGASPQAQGVRVSFNPLPMLEPFASRDQFDVRWKWNALQLKL